MPKFYQAATILVMPSLFEEGICRALVEAGVAGCALVGSEYGGLVDMIRDGETGLLVPPDDVGALAEALRSLLLSPAETDRLGRGAHARALEIYANKARGIDELRTRFNDYVSSGGDLTVLRA
jgi:glycosyltransferase involved in cell wall biosynthesis